MRIIRTTNQFDPLPKQLGTLERKLIRIFGPVHASVIQIIDRVRETKPQQVGGEHWAHISKSDLSKETGFSTEAVRDAFYDLAEASVLISIADTEGPDFLETESYRLDYKQILVYLDKLGGGELLTRSWWNPDPESPFPTHDRINRAR